MPRSAPSWDPAGLLAARGAELEALMERAREVREANLPGEGVSLCGILLAKCGKCPEDCGFCAQSRRSAAFCPTTPLASVEDMVERARQLRDMGARAFGVVAAGSRPGAGELDRICRAVERVRAELGLECCASLGRVSAAQLRRLRDAGLVRYHHNLEASRSFFPRVITTYEHEESLDTVRRAHDAGLPVCSSGVFGLGESDEQRVELIRELRDLAVESIPICFLEPHPGTPLGHREPLSPEEALAIIAVHRLMLPDRDIIVTGGRNLVLRGQTDRILAAGASGLMIEDYPSELGGSLAHDLRAIDDVRRIDGVL